MERDVYRVMVGSDATMLDRMARFAPKKAAEIIQKQVKDLLPD